MREGLDLLLQPPQTELEFLGESDREVNWGITWEVYSSLRYHWALGLAACENFLSECSEVGVMEVTSIVGWTVG